MTVSPVAWTVQQTADSSPLHVWSDCRYKTPAPGPPKASLAEQWLQQLPRSQPTSVHPPPEACSGPRTEITFPARAGAFRSTAVMDCAAIEAEHRSGRGTLGHPFLARQLSFQVIAWGGSGVPYSNEQRAPPRASASADGGRPFADG